MSASAFNTLAHLDVENRRVLVRLDLNQEDPLRPDAPDSSLSTIKELLHREARVILCGHRASSGSEGKLPSLRRAGSRLAEALGCPVQLPDEVVGDGVRKLIRDTRGGQVVLLENLDLDPREPQDSADLGRLLAELCDVFVLDAVQASLQSRASITQLSARMPEPARGIGHRLEAHLEASSALMNPDQDNTLIFGSHSPELLHLAALAKLVELREPKDPLVLAGALGRHFVELQQGKQPSEVPMELTSHMRAILQKTEERGLKLVLPHDIEEVPPSDPQSTKAPALVWGPQSRRDLIAALHMPLVAWVGPIQPSRGHQDSQWLGQRLAQHERNIIAVGPEAVSGLNTARQLADTNPKPPSDPGEEDTQAPVSTGALGLDFILSRVARAPIMGLEAIAVTEANHHE